MIIWGQQSITHDCGRITGWGRSSSALGVLSTPSSPRVLRLHRGLPWVAFKKYQCMNAWVPLPKFSDWIGLQSGWSFRNVKNPTPGDWNPCLTHPSQRQSSSPHAYSLIGFSKYPWQAVKINRVTFFLLGNLAVETLGYVADQHKAETRSQVLGLKVTFVPQSHACSHMWGMTMREVSAQP